MYVCMYVCKGLCKQACKGISMSDDSYGTMNYMYVCTVCMHVFEC